MATFLKSTSSVIEGTIKELKVPKRTIVKVLVEGENGVLRFIDAQKVITSQRWERYHNNPNKRNYQGDGIHSSTLIARRDSYRWVDYGYYYETIENERIDKVFHLTPDVGKQ